MNMKRTTLILILLAGCAPIKPIDPATIPAGATITIDGRVDTDA